METGLKSGLVATELKVQEVKMGIWRDDVFSATSPLEAVRLVVRFTVTESVNKLMFVDIRRAHFQSHPEDECLWSCLRNEKARLVWIVAQEHKRNTRRGGEFRSDHHGHTDERETRCWQIHYVFVHTRQQGHQIVLPR